jgi:hypothetical protein
MTINALYFSEKTLMRAPLPVPPPGLLALPAVIPASFDIPALKLKPDG